MFAKSFVIEFPDNESFKNELVLNLGKEYAFSFRGFNKSINNVTKNVQRSVDITALF